MRDNQYTTKQLHFLKAGYLKMRVPELAAAFNKKFGTAKTRSAIKAALSNHGFTCGRKTGGVKGTYRIFSREQAAFIKENYKSLSQEALAEAVNEAFGTAFTVGQIRSFTRNHGVKSGRTGRYEKDHKPWNSGTKGQGLTGPNSHSFKPGSVPPNIKPVGAERIDSKDGYILVKVNETDPYTGFPTRFKLKHIVVWEQVHGPVPKGKVLIFIDGDKTNCDIENLALVSRAELLRLNQIGYTETPAELRPSVLALAKLVTKVSGRKRAGLWTR